MAFDYCQLLCPKVQLEVEVKFVQDTLKGDDQTEIRVKFVKKLEDAVPAGENWICISNSIVDCFLKHCIMSIFIMVWLKMIILIGGSSKYQGTDLKEECSSN